MSSLFTVAATGFVAGAALYAAQCKLNLWLHGHRHVKHLATQPRYRSYPVSSTCINCGSADLIYGPVASSGRLLLCRNCTHEFITSLQNFEGKYAFKIDYGPCTAQRWTQVYRQPPTAVKS
jgi:hypothetical protein